MNKDSIKKGLPEYNEAEVSNYLIYLDKIANEKVKENGVYVKKNPWFENVKDDTLIYYFKRVKKENLQLDGKHITIQKTGLSYDYIAYKNKMLLSYPETKMFFSEVYEGDEFYFKNDSGKISYTHTFANPFSKDTNKIIGLYCVIKNKRGEFLTILNKDEINKHRKVAKTDSIWSSWELEMMYKTIIKKAVKVHFDDIFTGLEEIDNEQSDLTNPLNIELEIKQEIENIETLKELIAYYNENKDKQKSNLTYFTKYITARKLQIMEKEKNENTQS